MLVEAAILLILALYFEVVMPSKCADEVCLHPRHQHLAADPTKISFAPWFLFQPTYWLGSSFQRTFDGAGLEPPLLVQSAIVMVGPDEPLPVQGDQVVLFLPWHLSC